MESGGERAARAFVASAAAVGVAFALQIEWLESAQTWFAVFSGLAVLLGLAAWLYARPFAGSFAAPPEEVEAAPPINRARLLPVIGAVAALLAALVLLYFDLRSSLGGWLWLASLLAVVASVAALEPRRPPRPTAEIGLRRRRALWVGAVVLLALVLRTYRLEEIPGELVDDESLIAEWGMNALHGMPIWDGSTAEHSTIFRKGGAAEPLPGCVVHAAVMQVAGETIFGLRLTAALAGALGVLLLYLVLREFLGFEASLAGAFLLAICHTHLYWTRSGMLQALVTMAGTGVILFTLRGLRTRGYLPWLIAGVFLGAAQHFYEGGRFLAPILAPFFLLMIVARRGFARQHLLHVAAMALMSIAVFAPLGFWYLANPDSLLAITHGAFIFEQPDYLESRYPDMGTAEIVVAQLRKSLEGFTVHGDGGTFYPIWVPLLDPVVRALALAGVAGFLLTWNPAVVLINCWLWVPVLIACTVTSDPPPMSRLMLALPAVFALAAAMLERLGRLAENGYGAGGAAVARLLAVLLLAGAFLWNTDVFFVRYPAVFPVNLLTASAVAAADAGEGEKVFFLGQPSLSANAPTMRFLARRVAREDLELEAIPVQELGHRDALFFVANDMPEALERLREVYPGGAASEQLGPNGEVMFRAYRVGREEMRRAVGDDPTWPDPDRRFGWSGSAEGELSDARAIAVDAQGEVYVADGGNRRIQVFDRDGRLLRILGGEGAKKKVGEPIALAFDRDGNLLVVDANGHSVQRLRPDGESLGRIGSAKILAEAVGVAAAPDGTLVVADRGAHALIRLSPKGEELARTAPDAPLEEPRAVAVDGAGRIFVADFARARVLRFSPAFELEKEWEIPAGEHAPGQMLAVSDADGGAVYVVDPEEHRVQRFDLDGEKQWNVGSGGSPPEHLGWPTSVAVDAKGDVFVLDAERSSIYRFDVTRR